MTATVVLGPCADRETEASWLEPLAAKLAARQVPVLEARRGDTGAAGEWLLVATGEARVHRLETGSLTGIYREAARLATTPYVAFHHNGWDLDADELRRAAVQARRLDVATLRYLGHPADLLFAGLLADRRRLLGADWAQLRGAGNQARFLRGVVGQLGPALPQLADGPTTWPARALRPDTTYLVLGTPRTGSTLLCDALALAGTAGRPREYLIPGMAAYFYRMSGSRDAAGYFAHLHDAETENGVFGAKVHWPHLVSLQRELDEEKAFPFGMSRAPGAGFSVDRAMLGRLARTIDALAPGGKLVLTVRADAKAKAVSGFLAQRDEDWFTLVKGAGPAEVYDRAAIKALEDRYHAWDIQLTEFLERLGRPYLTVEYQDLASRYGETMAGVFDHLGVRGAVPRPRLVRQSHRTKAAVLERYRAEAG
jgi:LPS sulfotransferase NodH